jgi:uncharacterized sulfatase
VGRGVGDRIHGPAGAESEEKEEKEMKRRDFMKVAGSGVLASPQVGARPSRVEGPKGSGNARQVVFIMTDTTRWDMLNCYRNTGMKTPNLDRLASGGMRFERAYTCQPVCSPARSSIFTGAFPHTTGVWGNDMPLGLNVPTIGKRLADNGVHSCYIGKWHLDGTDYFGDGRCPEGWDKDYWYDGRRYLEGLSAADRRRSRDTRTNLDPNLTEGFTYGHRCSDRAVSFLSKHHEEPFFLVVSYDEPHGPSLCPRPYSEMYRDFEFPKSSNIWDTLANKPERQRLWAGQSLSEDKDALRIKAPFFFGCQTFIDYEIGRVLNAVDKYAPDALVIYTSDHGEFWSSHSLDGKGPAMYDEIARIPLLVRWPGRITPGGVCSHPVSHINLVPTILEAMGHETPKWLHGQSMTATLKNPALRPNDAVFITFGRFEVDHDGYGALQPIRCVFDGKHKLAINLLDTDELYDLEKDPDEMVNLIESSEYAEVRNRLHDRLIQWTNDTRDPFRGYYWERRPWRRDKVATWNGSDKTRQREEDGYEPRCIDYDTGLAMETAVRKME